MKRWFCLALILFLALTSSGLAEEVPTFARLTDAADFLNQQVQYCPEKIEFRVTNVDEYLDLSDFADDLIVLGGQYQTHVLQNGDLFQVQYEYYPGMRIQLALRQGDWSGLTDDEVRAAKIASQIVQEACAYPSAYERILYLHDWLCAHVTYEQMPEARPTMPRMCGAVGALVDGRANCQGYADAFRMLGTLCGLEVRKQSGYGEGEEHDWNVVRLADEWYIVDVTHDDTDDGDTWNYAYMIVGQDVCSHIPWRESATVAQVSPYTREDLFYYSRAWAVYDDMDALARGAFFARRDQGQTSYRAMLLNRESSWEELSDALLNVVKEQKKTCSWRIWCALRSGSSYYTVKWTEW